TLYKAPFPATNEDSLAGGLSNTIAGRICNYFDFQGGGYTVDGACASSLLAVATACSALQSGDVDIAIAGGVDLSLDPFELAASPAWARLRAIRCACLTLNLPVSGRVRDAAWSSSCAMRTRL